MYDDMIIMGIRDSFHLCFGPDVQMVSVPHLPVFARHASFINGDVGWRAEVRTGQSDMIKVVTVLLRYTVYYRVHLLL